MIPLWIILTLSSAVIFGCRDILMKHLFLKSRKSSLEIALAQFILAFFVFGALFWLVSFSDFIQYWYLFLIKAFLIGLGTFLYFLLVEKHSISIAAPMLNLTPVALLILSTIFLGEVVSLVQGFGVILLLGSTYLLTVHTFPHMGQHHHAHKIHAVTISRKKLVFFLHVFAIMIVFSVTAMTEKVLLQYTTVWSSLFFSGLLISVSVLLIRYRVVIKTTKALFTDKLFAGVTVLTLLSDMLVVIAIGLPTALVSLLIPLRRTSTLFSAVIGGSLFHEKHILQKAIAVIFMLVGILLIVF